MQGLRRIVAWMALAGFLSGQAAVWVATHDAVPDDDSACADLDGPSLIGHHAAGQQVEAATPPGPTDHCALCHLQRVVSGARLSRVAAATTAPHVMIAPVEQTVSFAFVVHSGLPSRGPPQHTI